MLIDYEKAWHEMRAHITSKSGHGSFGPEGLLAHMAQLEVECAVEEGPTERILRLFGVQVSEDLLQIVEAASGDKPIGQELSTSDHSDSKGASNGTTHHH